MTTVVWTHPAVLDGAERTSEVPADFTIEQAAEYVARAYLPFGIEGLDALRIVRFAGTIAARDLVVGHYVTSTPGQWTGAIGDVVLVDKSRPGEVWAWLNTYPNGLAFERRGPDLMLNHGDPVAIAKHRRA